MGIWAEPIGCKMVCNFSQGNLNALFQQVCGLCVHGGSRAERSVRKHDVGKEKRRDVGEESNMSKMQEVERRGEK